MMKKSLANSATMFWNSRRTRGGRAACVAFLRSLPNGPMPATAPGHLRSLSSAAVSDRGGAIIPAASLSMEAIHLPPADDPVGLGLYKKAIYCPVSRILRTSAHVGTDDANGGVNGIVGDTVAPEDARNHARNSGLRLLATIHHFLDGDLERVEQVLHLRGLVKATPGFAGHAGVIDGCSEVLAEAFGPDAGVGTRECFGTGSLGSTVACVLELRVRPKE